MSSAQTRVGVAVIGLGVGEQHARAYLALGRCQVRWLYDLDSSKAQSLSEGLGAGAVATSLEQILEDRDVQIVSIASYDDAHYAHVLAALEAGKHVFVEKPLCRTADELRMIKQAWARHGGRLKLASNLVLRAAPIYRWLKERIQAGDFGEVYAFDGDYLYGRLQKITEGWRKNVEHYSVIEGGGIHLIDLMLWLTGERPKTVSAMGNRICTQDTAFRYDDFVAATMQADSGMVARITANFGSVHRHQHVLRVFGTCATFIYDDAGARYHLTRDPAVTASPVTLPALPVSKGDLIPAFVSAVMNDTHIDADIQSFFDGISLCIACDNALANHSIEEVKYV